MMNSFALFRLPYEKRCTLVVQTNGEPKELMSCNELAGQQGFVMAPFAVSSKHPLLLIRADEVTSDLTDLDGLSDLGTMHLQNAPFLISDFSDKKRSGRFTTFAFPFIAFANALATINDLLKTTTYYKPYELNSLNFSR